ncbi:MAG: hypothetical protein U0559_02325 [Anaerolineae bacterium]
MSTGLDYQFERFLLSLQLRVQQSTDKDPRLQYAELISMEINRHGDFILIGKNISSTMIRTIKRMDISLRINPILPEAALRATRCCRKRIRALSGLTVVMGIGAEVNYIGGGVEGVASGTGTVRLGGDLCSSAPSSQIARSCRRTSKELMDKLSEIPGSGNQIFTGFLLARARPNAHLRRELSIASHRRRRSGGLVLVVQTIKAMRKGGKLRGYVFGSFHLPGQSARRHHVKVYAANV